MNGYGITPEQYGQALQAFDELQRRQDMQAGIARTGNPYAALGAALGNMVAGKFGKYKDTNITEASEQIRKFQEQKAAELQAAADAKAKREAEAARKNKLLDKTTEHERELEKINRKGEIDSARYAEDRKFRRDLQDDQQSFTAEQNQIKRTAESSKPDYKAGNDLRKEFQSLPPVKAFDEVNSSYQKMVKSAENPTGANRYSHDYWLHEND